MLPIWLTDTVTSDLDRALHYTLLWGLEGVELRTVGGPSDRVPFVNEEKLKRRLFDDELPVEAIVPGMFEGAVTDRLTWLNEVAMFDETLRFCTRIGCPRVVVSGFAEAESGEVPTETAADALRRVAPKAERAGVTVAVLNEVGLAHATGEALAQLLEAVDHPHVQAAWSPAAAYRSGEDPAVGLAALDGRVALVRCFDGQGRGDAWEPAPFGEGEVPWRAQLQGLHRQGYDGPLSLELHVEPRAKQGVREAGTLIQLLRDLRR